MKILFADSSIKGHHSVYLSTLYNNLNCEMVMVLPDVIIGCPYKIYKCIDAESPPKTMARYREYIKRIREVAAIEKPDIIHILTGDIFRKYGGYLLGELRDYQTVITMHQLPDTFRSKVGAFFTCKKINTVVVHTQYLRSGFKQIGIRNVSVVNYPAFDVKEVSGAIAKSYFGLSDGTKVIAAIGNTRYDKGLDILLQALQQVKNSFQLLIAGNEEAFKKDYIEEACKAYSDKVHLCLHYLSDEELTMAMNAADIIAIPYRRRFNAASGPMIDGTWLGKCIVGPSHGALGNIIMANHLGYTFTSEDSESLRKVIDVALAENFVPDETYLNYRTTLTIEDFVSTYSRLYEGIAKE